MGTQNLEFFKKIIFSFLKNVDKGIYDINRYNIFDFKKRGIPEEFISKTILEYCMENEDKVNRPLSRNYNARAYDIVKENGQQIFIPLIKQNMFDIIIKFFEKFYNYININYYLSILYYTDFNLKFFQHTQDLFELGDRNVIKLFSLIDNGGDWDKNYVKKFLIYFLNDINNLTLSQTAIATYFNQMDIVLKKFIIYKTPFFKDKYPNHNLLIAMLNELKPKEWGLVKDIIEMYDIKNETKYDLSNFYADIRPEFKEILFPNEKDFYHYLVEDIHTKPDDTISLIGNMFEETFDAEEIVKFFHYNPNFIKDANDKLPLEFLVKIKFGYSNLLPKEIISEIKLPMTETALLESDEIIPLVYDDRDGTSSWIGYYIDEDLWEHTHRWDYDDVIVPFDEISPKNLELIKKYLKDNGVEGIDEMDRDDLDGAMMENGELSSVLRISSEHGHRMGDEAELIKDIENVLNELFPNGWKRSDKNFKYIEVVLDLNDLTDEEISYGYDRCGDWDVKCMWLDQMSEKSNRDKPSLPEYRYGIQGDFDVEEFNYDLGDRLSEII